MKKAGSKKNFPSSYSAPKNTDFPIVGVGASAGGLEAFSQLLSEIPADSGMAFVLIQHLDPAHDSYLSQALEKATKMPVLEITNNTDVKPNHVYVIPPSHDLDIHDGKIELIRRRKMTGVSHLPIDTFFRALAKNCPHRAIGVVLSGNANDGTEGLKAIKDEGGLTFAQEPNSAKFRGMPESAIRARAVDFALPIPEIAEELLRLSSHSYYSNRKAEPFSEAKAQPDFNRVLTLLKKSTGVDFQEYKSATTKRRLSRRMALLHVDSLTQYIKYLGENPGEPAALCADILIHVTSFFRDPEAFQKLKTEIFPKIMKKKNDGRPLRIWVAGCASGEEVYSLGIAFLEYLGETPSHPPIQIFGSDISDRMIEKARAGFYPDSLMRNISPERMRRFFVKVEGGYRISKLIRDFCVFVKHDLARDPPFSRLDLITCRNVLIYFDQPLQKRILSTFHYCLNKSGYLMLGRTENVSSHQQLFFSEDKIHKIFSRNTVPSQLRFDMPSESTPKSRPATDRAAAPNDPGANLSRVIDNLLIATYAPCGVLVNDRMEVIQFRGRTSQYLEQPAGEPEMNLLKMVKEGLFVDLKMAISKAKKESILVRKDGVWIKQKGLAAEQCNIIVRPVSGQVAGENLLLILFEETLPPTKNLKPAARKLSGKQEKLEQLRSAKLEQELNATKEYLQAINLEHQSANDALASANEEFVSGNEELQSMNEELETAKEELQSTNEEPTTVNDELQNRNLEVGSTNNDLINLLDSVEMPIVILDLNHKIRRFTPHVKKIMNLLSSDIGRSIDDIKLNLRIENLAREIDSVISSGKIETSEVQDGDGSWHQLQIRPYKTTEQKIDGVILSLVDINTLRQARLEAEQANRTKDLFLATLSHELRTPLTSLILQVQLLRRGKLDESRVQRAAEKIETAAKMQAQLIEDLLDISRIVTGKLKIHFEPVDLPALVRLAVEAVVPLAGQSSIKIDLDLEELPKKVTGDPVRLQQVIWNLLTNAIKFSPADSRIKVSLRADGNQAVLKVVDKGIGIDAEFLPDIFNRFTQAEGSITRKHGGLGLGLAIVRHLVEMHGGSVSVKSLGKNEGSTFKVCLPLKAAQKKKKKKKLKKFLRAKSKPVVQGLVKALRASKLSGHRILVVDDDLGTREALRDLLLQTGAKVRTAPSAVEGLRLLREFKPEELICDISMPDEDGYTFLRKVRKLSAEDGGNIPALALTALASANDREDAFAAGFQMHLAKPVDFEHLEIALVNLRGNKNLMQ